MKFYISFLLFLGICVGQIQAQERINLTGKVLNKENAPIEAAVIFVEGTQLSTITDKDGEFTLILNQKGNYTLKVSCLGYNDYTQSLAVTKSPLSIRITLQQNEISLNEVEVFGERAKHPEGLEFITRMPLQPKEQIQTVSVISEKLIQQQGNQTVIEAARNVPGIYMYATYGNTSQSISSRGYRGIPIYKNGVRMHTNQRGYGFINDMESVESIQVLKGASAVTMGAATDLGSPGGLINVVSKIPHFINRGVVSMRVGSFGQYRPAFDIQQVLDKNDKLALRVNGGYENSRDYHKKKDLGIEKFFVNPSLAWKPDDKTSIILELDYLDDSRTNDFGTVNLDPANETNQIYDLPKNRFLGFNTDRQYAKSLNYGIRFKRTLSDKVYLRASYVESHLNLSGMRTSLTALKDAPENKIRNQIFQRAIGADETREERNSTLQIDLIGTNLMTGSIAHTFMAGLDYSSLKMNAKNAPRRGGSLVVDTIDILKPVNNVLPAGFAPAFDLSEESDRTTRNFGIILQDVISLTKWAKVYGAVRLTRVESTSEATTGANDYRSTFVNPLAGFMISATSNINIFGSYTNSTHSPWEFGRNGLDKNGKELDNERSDQFEIGIKSEWFNNRLRFYVTGYLINNRNMIMQAAERNPETGFVEYKDYNIQGGNDERKGVEVELSGRVIDNLEVILGYAYIDAKYKESTVFMENSAPNNTPKNTFNAWANYIVDQGPLKGLSIGAGVYYLGKRPYNDWTKEGSEFHGIQPGLKPWYNKAYTIANAQVGYQVNQNWDFRLLINNIFDAEGYDAYRTAYINRIEPFNVAGTVSYRF